MQTFIRSVKEKYEAKILEHEQAIARLRTHMDEVINNLSADLGVEIMNLPTPISKTVQRSKSGKTMRDRTLLALDKMPSDGFGTSELRSTVSNDGDGEINRNTFLQLFRDLKEKGIIEIVSERQGNAGGLYRKAASKETAESTPTDSLGLDLINWGGKGD